jgi:hypothetical protein
MKVLSVQQPYASLILTGIKHYETRSWSTSYRGLLAIHASRRWMKDGIPLCFQEPMRSMLKKHFRSMADMPLSCILGTVELVDCITEEAFSHRQIDEKEREIKLGNFSPGRFAWQLTNPQWWPETQWIQCPGQLGIWNYETTRLQHSQPAA